MGLTWLTTPSSDVAPRASTWGSNKHARSYWRVSLSYITARFRTCGWQDAQNTGSCEAVLLYERLRLGEKPVGLTLFTKGVLEERARVTQYVKPWTRRDNCPQIEASPWRDCKLGPCAKCIDLVERYMCSWQLVLTVSWFHVLWTC